MMRSLGNGSIVVLHKEYIRDIPQTNNFTSNPFTINPGLENTFPWLSQIADAYEEYRIRGCVFTFKTTTTPYNQEQKSLGLGTVMLAAQYNVNNPVFTNKRDLENYTGSQSASPLVSQQMVVQPTGPLKTLYIRTGNVNDANYDPRMYDFARFEIATTGMTPSNGTPGTVNENIGELWVTYEIELIKPRFRPGQGKTDHYTLVAGGANANVTGTYAVGSPFGTGTINATVPVISAINPRNGYFGLGTFIAYDGASNENRIYIPDSLANKLIRIEFLGLVVPDNEDMCANAVQRQNWLLTIPNADVGSFATRLFSRTQASAISTYVCPAGTAFAATDAGSRAYTTYTIQLGPLNQASSGQYFAVKYANAPNSLLNASVLQDVVITVLDPQYWGNGL